MAPGICSLVAVFAAGMVLSACSSTPTPDVDYKTDYNFMNVKKIAFYFARLSELCDKILTTLGQQLS